MHRRNVFFVLLASVVFLSCQADVYARQGGGGGGQKGGGQGGGNKGDRRISANKGSGAQSQYKAGQQGQRRDWDNNPPGKAGGPGTNWENKPGPQGGPGASPDMRPNQWKQGQAAVDRPWEKRADANRDGTVDEQEINQWKNRHRDRGEGTPGQEGNLGAGSDMQPGQWKENKAAVDERWEKRADTNQDGVVDEVEINQWRNRSRYRNQMGVEGQGQGQRRDWDNNPPGKAGGPGTNWENKPGPQGGPGASPDMRQ